MGVLADEAKKRSPFLIVADGDSVIGIYRGFRFVPNSYDPTKPDNAQFEIEVDGVSKFLRTSSAKILLFFDNVKEGEEVKISRTIVNEKSRWSVDCVPSSASEDLEADPEMEKEFNKAERGEK